jgi:hypothetical protein
MWIVGINRPYYPDTEIFTDEVKARKYYEELLTEDEGVGENDSYVFIAKIDQVKHFKTAY